MDALRIVHEHDLSNHDRSILFDRRASLDEIMPAVRTIMATVKAGGDTALLDYTARFDGVRLDRLDVTDEEFERAAQEVDRDVLAAIEAEFRAVEAFHRVQMPRQSVVETMQGVNVWREWRPITRVGLYVPGGRGPYPSSVIMLGVPAAIAGCPDVVLCTPPGPDGAVPAATLCAARRAGIHRVFKLGGAQAIAAMAYGSKSVPAVDKLFGAGNAYVTAAKLLAFPGCDLDAPAGPSELLIIADDSATPAWIAADLLSDAEHGPDSPAVLLTTTAVLAARVVEEIEIQLSTLPRQWVARQALTARGLIVVVETLDDAVRLANSYAPEHLEIMTAQPHALLPRIQHAGSVFVGPYTPNAAGDYATGANHVLPTAGYARTFSPVSVESFGRLLQFQEASASGLASLLPTVQQLARAEGLEGHARAVETRFDEPANHEGTDVASSD